MLSIPGVKAKETEKKKERGEVDYPTLRLKVPLGRDQTKRGSSKAIKQ